MDPHSWGELFFAVAVGTIAGGMTDTVSIYLLFRPYEPKGIGPFKIQGALPKNKSRLARSIAKTVGERLLTAEDLAARLNTPSVRATFDAAIGQMVDQVVGQERGPLRAHLSPEFAAALDEALAAFAPRVAERVSDWFRTPEGVGRVAEIIHKLRAEVRDRPLAEVLTPERRDALRVRIDGLVDQFVDGPELERTLRRFLESQAEQLAGDERPLLSRLPPGVVGAVEQAITDYIPVALERLGGLLAEPDVRRRVEHALRAAFDASVRELLIHERLLARLVVTDRTIERLVDGFEREGFDRFADALASPAMREDLAFAVRDAVVSFLRVPAAERLRALGGTRTNGAVGSLGDWLVTIVRDETTRRVLAGAADRAVESLERWTWGDVLDALPADRVRRALRHPGPSLGGGTGARAGRPAPLPADRAARRVAGPEHHRAVAASHHGSGLDLGAVADSPDRSADPGGADHRAEGERLADRAGGAPDSRREPARAGPHHQGGLRARRALRLLCVLAGTGRRALTLGSYCAASSADGSAAHPAQPTGAMTTRVALRSPRGSPSTAVR
jgi:hypothetical protein